MKAFRFSLLLASSSLLLTAAFIFSSRTLAHAELRRSDPEAGAVLDRSPMEVSAWFSSQLSTGSKIGVFDGQFQVVDKGETFIDASDATRMRAEVVSLSPGRYTVNWKAVAIDGHVSNGSYDFTVREAPWLSPLTIAIAVGGVVIAAVVILIAGRLLKRLRRSPRRY
jgi:copper resistance protein C